MSADNMQDLLVGELQDIYSAETQLTKALPQMAKGASNERLATAFRSHLAETEEHVVRLEEAFRLLGKPARAKKCKGMEGLIAKGAEALEEGGEPDVVDAQLIADAQRVEHYEMAAYGAVKAIAQQLGYDDLAELLDQTLEEEKAAHRRLTEIAESEVNPRVMMAGSAGQGE